MGIPSVAVVIPTFNRWPHVCRAVDSVLAQTHADTRCVVVDDASTDDSPRLLRDRYGDRIVLIVKPVNAEKSAARNDGVRALATDYVCMCDSDDELPPDSVASRLAVFAADPAFNGVAYGVSDRGRPPAVTRFTAAEYQGDILDAYLRDPFIDNNNYLLSRQNMLRAGMYPEAVTNREDIELLLRLACRLPFRFCGSVVAKVNRVDRSARSNHGKIIAQGRAFTEALFANPDVVDRLGGERCRRLRYDELDMLAWAFYKARRFPDFRDCAREIKRDYADLLRKPGRLRKRWLLSFVWQGMTSQRNPFRMASR